MRNNTIANNVFFLKLNNTNFHQVAEAMNGIDKSILATENFQVRLLGEELPSSFPGLFHYLCQTALQPFYLLLPFSGKVGANQNGGKAGGMVNADRQS